MQGWSHQLRGLRLQLEGEGGGQGVGGTQPFPVLSCPWSFSLSITHTHKHAHTTHMRTGKYTDSSAPPHLHILSPPSPSCQSKSQNRFDKALGSRGSPLLLPTLLLRSHATSGCDCPSLSLRLPTPTVGMSCHTLPPGYPLTG